MAAGLDVVRTDRALVYYESEANQAKLWDILSVYAWIDGEVGYMQGKFPPHLFLKKKNILKQDITFKAEKSSLQGILLRN